MYKTQIVSKPYLVLVKTCVGITIMTSLVGYEMKWYKYTPAELIMAYSTFLKWISLVITVVCEIILRVSLWFIAPSVTPSTLLESFHKNVMINDNIVTYVSGTVSVGGSWLCLRFTTQDIWKPTLLFSLLSSNIDICTK